MSSISSTNFPKHIGRMNTDTEIFLENWSGSWNFPFSWILFFPKRKSEYYAKGGGSEIMDSEGSVSWKRNRYCGGCKK